jgi:ribosomal protein S18 acetylase RimI-like enzyme
VNVDLRAVETEDAHACASFFARVFPAVHSKHLSPEAIEEYGKIDKWLPFWSHFANPEQRRGGAHAAIALQDDRIVGVSFSGNNLESHRPRSGGFLSNLYVDPAFHRRGIGGMLLCDALAHCQNCIANQMTVHVLSCDPSAKAFYLRYGAQFTGTGFSNDIDKSPVDHFIFKNLRKTLAEEFGIVTRAPSLWGRFERWFNRQSFGNVVE